MREWLRVKRTDASMTEMEVSKLAGVAQPFYHNIEMGYKNPSVETAKKIAAVLEFPWTRFYEEEQE